MLEMQKVEKRLKNLVSRHWRKIHQKLLKRYNHCFVRSFSYRLLRPERIPERSHYILTLSLHAFPKLLGSVSHRVLGQMDFWADSVQLVVF